MTHVLVIQASAVTGGADVAASAQRVVSAIDVRATATALASVGATSISVASLPMALANGTAITWSGGNVCTLSAGAAQGATSLTVVALVTTAIANGETGGILIPNGSDINFTPDAGSTSLCKL